MNKSNIVSTFTIPDISVSFRPVGVVLTNEFTSTDEVLEDAVRIGNELGADWIVGFNFQSQPSMKRVNRTWKGFGTAVKQT
jgi:hypothetical protein